MRVLAITPELPRDDRPGSNAPLARQLESLRKRGVEFSTIQMRGIPMLKYLLAIPKVRQQIRQADLVHAHFGFCGWLGRSQFRKPLVISFMGDDLLGEPNDHGGISKLSRFMIRANKNLAPKADQVIVKSPEMAYVLRHVTTHTIPNGVDTQRFRPIDLQQAREALGWDQDETVILFPGDPENPRKGFTLANAATKVAEERLGRTIRIQPMWGFAPDEVPLLMNACQAMWMTSIIEGSPNVVKEALACDRPVVGVPVGDVEWVLDGVEGCRFCDRDPQQLGLAMAELLANGRDSEGRAAIESKRLSLDDVASQVLDVYHLALGTDPSNEASGGSTESSSSSSLSPEVTAGGGR